MNDKWIEDVMNDHVFEAIKDGTFRMFFEVTCADNKDRFDVNYDGCTDNINELLFGAHLIVGAIFKEMVKRYDLKFEECLQFFEQSMLDYDYIGGKDNVKRKK